jgi:HAD superfamily hydrolase (TIGR01549 family)
MDRRQSEYVHMNTADQSVAFLFEGDSRLAAAQAYRAQMSYHPFIPIMRMEPHLKELLERLSSRFKTAIATNRSDTMDAVLEAHGLTESFDLVVSSLDVPAPKPAPDALLKIIKYFGISSGEAVYIGDSEIDALTAVAARVPFIAYKNPELAADWHAEHFREIERWLFSES